MFCSPTTDEQRLSVVCYGELFYKIKNSSNLAYPFVTAINCCATFPQREGFATPKVNHK